MRRSHRLPAPKTMVLASVVLFLIAIATVALGNAGSAPGQQAAGARKKPGRPVERFVCRRGRRGAQKGAATTARHRRIVEVVGCRKGKQGPRGNPGVAGVPGLAGPPGGPGPRGAAGPAAATTVIHRTTIPYLTSPPSQTDGGNVQNLATIGPIHIDGLCRHTSVDNSPGQGESEAQIIVWTETGSLTFRGQVGPRSNIPSGPPDYGLGDSRPGVPSDPVAGEGDHLFVTGSNENYDGQSSTDPKTNTPGNPATFNRQLNRRPGFGFAHGPILTSDGHFVIAGLFAGLDVLGAYDTCVFGGSVRSLS